LRLCRMVFFRNFWEKCYCRHGHEMPVLREVNTFGLSSLKYWVKKNSLILLIAVKYLCEKFLIRMEFHLLKILFEYFRELWGIFLPPDACRAEESSSFLCSYLSFHISKISYFSDYIKEKSTTKGRAFLNCFAP